MTPGDTRMSAEQRKLSILDAALNVFASKGFSGARTKEIAKEAGVSETILFRHFKNKENLYIEALQHLFAHHPLEEDMEPAMRAGDDREVLFTLAHHIIRHVGRDKRIVRLIFYSSLEGLHVAKHERTPIQILEGYFAGRMAEGALRKRDPGLTARFFLFSVYLYVSDMSMNIYSEPVTASDEEAARTLADIFMEGLLPR